MAGNNGAPQMNFLKEALTEGSLNLESGMTRAVPLSQSGPATLGIRPDPIGVDLKGVGDAQVSVRNFEQLGATTCIYTAFGNGETLTVQLPAQFALERGQTNGVTMPEGAIHTIAGEGEVVLTRQ